MENNKKIGLYLQDCEFFRYYNKLSWGRFQTVLIIEGVLLLWLYGIEFHGDRWALIRMLSIGFLLILGICIVGLMDGREALRYRKKILEFDEAENNAERSAVPSAAYTFYMRLAGIILLNVFNLFTLLTQILS